MTDFKKKTATEKNPISEARLAANRENAQKSHGPLSPEGKAKSCLNAIKLNLTGQHILFASEEESDRYDLHIDSYEQQFQPLGPEEQALVQSIADLRWRLARIPAIEFAILASGSISAIEVDSSLAETGRETLLELQVRRTHEKELRNLGLTENRLARRCERELKRLETLQSTRKENEEQALAEAAKATLLAKHHQRPLAQTPGLGFVFSESKFTSYMSRLNPAQRQKLLQEALTETAEAPQSMEATA